MTQRVVTDFGLVLRNLRVNLGYTQGYIADYIGKSRTYVCDVEKGDCNAPKKDVLRNWLRALQCEDRYEELHQLALLNKTQFYGKLKPNDPSNPFIMRLVEKYNTNTLTDFDRQLLSCIE